LRELGYIEGQNVVIEGRYYGDSIERLPALAAELVRLQVDAMVVGSPPAPEVAKRATSTIPIVLTNHSDPVGSGLVASLARPAGNVTGLSRAPALRGSSFSCSEMVLVAWRSSSDHLFRALDLSALETAAQSLVALQVRKRSSERPARPSPP
jgi:putative ABC transport system substrate-binding protein